MPAMRNDTWLQSKLDYFLTDYFSDLELPNDLKIKFGRRAKRRFGSIKMTRDKKVSQITINGVFRDPKIPEDIILATIAHELCHYVHGFSSPLKQKYRHPHRGGVIPRELQKRGLFEFYRFEKTWTKQNWPKILKSSFPKTRTVRRRIVRRRQSPLLKLLFELVKP